MRFSILFLFLCFFSLDADAQVRKILHQSFDIESSNTITLDLAGEYQIVKWAGNAILVESSIELYAASKAIFKAFKDEGRYDVEAETEGDLTTLRSVDLERLPIRNKDREECFEIVKVRVLIPEDFNVQNQKTLTRSTPIEANSGQ